MCAASAKPTAAKISALVRYAMCLCSEDFETADSNFGMIGTKVPESAQLLQRYVLKQSYSSTETYYIVFDPEGTYTSREPPEWATPACVFEMPVETPQRGATLERMCELVESVEQNGDSLDRRISDWFEDVKGAEGVSAQERLARLLQTVVNAPRIDSKGVSAQYTDSIQTAMVEEFHQFRFTGNLARRIIAYAMFVGVHPDGDKVYLGNFCAIELDSSPGQKIYLPVVDLKHYFALSLHTSGSSFIVARGAARLARRTAKNFISQAIRRHVLAEFFRLLYAALLFYRVAMFIYDEMKTFGSTNPDAWSEAVTADEVQASWIECEEARVAISLSILASVEKIDGFPSILDPIDFLAWVELKARFSGPDIALGEMSEGVVALLFPEFIRDLGQAHLVAHCGAKRAPDRIAKALSRHVAALSQQEQTIVAVGEAAYQVQLLQAIIEMHRLSGDLAQLHSTQLQLDQLMQRVRPTKAAL